METPRKHVADIDERVRKGLTKCFEFRNDAEIHARKTGSYCYELENFFGQAGKWAVPK